MLTKVGVYALLRVMVMILPADLANLGALVSISAFLTMVLAGLGAIAQHDIRRTVGYVVIVGIGNIFAGVAVGGVSGLEGALVYALHSMVLMTALYFIVGLAGKLAGGFSLVEIGGLYRSNPAFAGLSLAAFFAAAGLPPFSGFWPKAILVRATLDDGSWWLTFAILFAGFCTTIALGRIFLLAYWRPATEPPAARVKLPLSQSLPVVALMALVVVFGVYPEPLLTMAGRAVAGILSPEAYFMSVFPGEISR
nr:proton-conducting transporter membrane subunit [Marinicella sp. W31]MDC2876525.1 proton-conducting transporter membrane subunit [Marinicella sp. W31]